MQVFDLAHAYQPFKPPDFIPDWVEKNLAEIFLPLSRAMREGLVKRGLQLQGWTINSWLETDEPIRGLVIKTLENLEMAAKKGNIELGASGYAHPILPLLGDEVIKRQVEEDIRVVTKFLGKPTWFWFPEGAADKRTLTLVHEVAPDLTVLIPDGCLGKREFSGFVRLDYGDENYQQALICNTLLKDIFMNAEDYKERPDYAPARLNWEAALKATHSGDSFRDLLRGVGTFGNIVLARDLENAGSKYGLTEFEGGAKEVKGLVESKLDFALPGQVDWKNTPLVKSAEIKPSSWEPAAKEDDPYPYWAPIQPSPPLQGVVEAWKSLVEVFNRSYHPDLSRECLIVLASDVPWHFLGKKEWGPNPQHSIDFTRKVILPLVKRLEIPDLLEAGENLQRLMEDSLKKIHGA